MLGGDEEEQLEGVTVFYLDCGRREKQVQGYPQHHRTALQVEARRLADMPQELAGRPEVVRCTLEHRLAR